MEDIASGQELTISYTGPEGYTNQRLMAQYGFVPPDGNPADRLSLELPPSQQGTTVSLERLQSVIGDRVFVDCLSGKNPYVLAAMKSLPLRDEFDQQAATAAAAAAAAPEPTAEGAAASGRDLESMPLSGAEKELAQALYQQCEVEISQYATSMQEDALLLQQAAGSDDMRSTAVLQYRLERKRLLNAASTVLKLYFTK